jgi:hypothetical protein
VQEKEKQQPEEVKTNGDKVEQDLDESIDYGDYD